MTIHEALCTSARQPLLTVCLLLLTLQIALIFSSFRNARSGGTKLINVLLFVFGFALFYLPLLDICWDINYPAGEIARPTVLAAFGAMPLAIMVLMEILFSLAIIAELRDLIRYKQNHPRFESVKETMDLLPAGIAFARPDGTVVFSNLAMNKLSRTLSGNVLTDLSAFRKAAADDNSPLDMPDGSVWQFAHETLELDGESYAQLTATDITEQAAITKELEDKNTKLREIHMRLDIYNKQADRIVIAQELLTARMAVHSEVGNVLLESRHYLKDPASYDEEKLLQALKNTNTYLLREYEEDDSERDPLTDALEMAEAIGVDVELTGVIPQEDPARKVLAAAISECASNTVKHAEGDKLFVNILLGEGDANRRMRYIVTLTNNGRQPTEAIRESGGLLSLRKLAEQSGGSMAILVLPHFQLIIRLP